MDYCARTLAKSWGLYFVVAGSIFISSPLSSFAADPVNTVNNGRIVQSGTFYNTNDGTTTFKNSGPGGVWIQNGTTIRGLEVNSSGNLTNNGGTFHILAPGSVVRIDGKVDVNAVANGNGAYLGNGGKVFIDSAYLYQSGQISANGTNGGLVQMNVGSAVFSPTSKVEAKGIGGNGGVIAINSDGVIDIATKALLDSSGKVAGAYDSNLINIEAGAIRHAGTLRADGVVLASAQDGSRGGTIRLVTTGNTNLNHVASAIDNATQVAANDPNKIATVSLAEAQQWKTTTNGMVTNQDGSIVILGPSAGRPDTGLLSAEGSRGMTAANNDYIQNPTQRAGDGGSIILSAMNNVTNVGKVSANGGDGLQGTYANNGGNGGTIAVTANGNITVSAIPQLNYRARFVANGGRGGKYLGVTPPFNHAFQGGSGGLIAFGYNGQMQNSGVVQASGGVGGGGSTLVGQLMISGAQGGQGGLIAMSGNANPTGIGILDANGGRGGDGLPGGNGGLAGTIVAVNPQTLGNTQIAYQANGGKGNTLGQLTPPPAVGAPRPLTQQTAENELLSNGDTLILLTRNTANAQRFADLSDRAKNAKMRSVKDPNGTGQAGTEMLAKDAANSSSFYRHFVISSSADTLRLNMNRNPVFSLQNSEIQLNRLNTLTVLNDGYATNTSEWDLGNSSSLSGGHISILANGDIENGSGFLTMGQMSGGSINLASKGTINNYDLLSTTNINDGKGIHGGSLLMNAGRDITNFGFRLIAGSGGLIGGTQRLNATRNIMNLGDITAVAFNSNQSAPTTAGNISIRAGGQFTNGNEVFAPCSLQANVLANVEGYGGYIRVRAQNIDNTYGSFDASGPKENGQVVTNP